MPNMRRAISHKLQAWSESSHRKPLVIFGARQVGKTYAIKQLASDRYDSLAYIDFSRDARAAALFEYLTCWGPGLLRLGAIMSFGGYCVSRPGLLRLGAVVG